MKLLVIGSGGREHALAWRLSQSPQVHTVYVAPGNGGTATTPKLQNVPLNDKHAWLAFAQENNIAFTVVGPEAPLADGVVDLFRAHGQRIFGPTQAAAQLESSKDFAKAFMVRHGIPTAPYATFTQAEPAHRYIDEQGAPIVIKADGLAAGKGVIVATTLAQAHQAVDDMFAGHLGQAGARVVIEGFLHGEEASFMVMVHHGQVLPLASSQDHKRQLDGDQGPNTGGMGAYSPAPIVSDHLHERIMQEVIHPTVQGMLADGIPFTGFLYAGLMIDEGPDDSRKIQVLEFNCRMGDPETQPILMRIRNDFTTVVAQAIDGQLEQAHIDWDPRSTLGVVLAAKHYPATPQTGDPITGIPAPQPDCVTFHAGTRLVDDTLLTSGGRVLCVTAIGDTVEQARAKAYATVEQIHFDGVQYRRDIAWRALKA